MLEWTDKNPIASYVAELYCYRFRITFKKDEDERFRWFVDVDVNVSEKGWTEDPHYSKVLGILENAKNYCEGVAAVVGKSGAVL